MCPVYQCHQISLSWFGFMVVASLAVTLWEWMSLATICTVVKRLQTGATLSMCQWHTAWEQWASSVQETPICLVRVMLFWNKITVDQQQACKTIFFYQCDRELWSVGPARWHRLGAQEHPLIWWRPRKYHHLWRICGRSKCRPPGKKKRHLKRQLFPNPSSKAFVCIFVALKISRALLVTNTGSCWKLVNIDKDAANVCTLQFWQFH